MNSIQYLLVAALSLVPRSLGAPTGEAAQGTTQTATAVPTPYQGLGFPTFSVGPPRPSIVSLIPQSLPNYAVSGVRGQTLAASNPMITTAQVTVAGASACTVQVTGTKAGTGEMVGPELINFAPANADAGTGISLQSGMAFASFSDLTGLSSVTLQIILSSIPAAAQQTTSLHIDNVEHTNYE
ncbi:MAG: hypothetical protein M1826_001683 [Phylliscum demangeonii]|nr:MAG: hypothetical protein M1826_001683 [Phylliscum demangeonii]